jgi:hypothetical protein
MTIRLRLATMLAGVVLVLAACGGTASPSPSATASASSPASAQPSVEPSAAPSASEGALPSIPDIDLDAAAQALENVDSYRLRMAVEGANAATIEATVVRRPEVAQDVVITTGGTSQHLIIVGDEAWIDPGAGTFVSVPLTTVQGMTRLFDPVLLASGLNQPGVIGGLDLIGPEEKNGVPTTHYHLDGQSPVGQLASLPPDAVFDVWIAQEGYMVSMVASGIDPTTPSVSMDISNINDPANVVEAPSS